VLLAASGLQVQDVRMAATSAGILLYRVGPGGAHEVLLAHPGGPYWRGKDAGAWSVPKGEHAGDEDPLTAARREYAEELGHPAPDGPFRPLGTVRQARGKRVTAWAVEGELDPASVVSNTAQIMWPPRSGRIIEVPEVDRVAWFDLTTAREKLNAGQVPLLDRLRDLLLADS
jgi:predicted NUDIX family NTP pyrophosphohydrolase